MQVISRGYRTAWKQRHVVMFSTARALQRALPMSDVLRRAAQDKIANLDAARRISPALIDSHARPHDYLRISLTERCNLRCFYCMPQDGIELSPKSHILGDDEVVRLATLFVKSGVKKIRLTGGEPTIRKNIVDIVGRLNDLRQYGLESIGMTTNGLVLHRLLPSLLKNGLTHVNISLDTMDPFKFEIMTRRPGHQAVLRSLNASLDSPLLETKVNVVVMKGLNDHEVLDFIKLTQDKPLSVRFIEFMPFTGNKWDSGKMVPSADLLERIVNVYPTIAKVSDAANDTARSYRVPGHVGTFGFISSMSDHFCSTCNRLRITADGQIKVCLFDAKEISLRDRMRQGSSDEELLRVIGSALQGKAKKHALMDDIDVVANRPMILIGGIQLRKRPHRSIVEKATLFTRHAVSRTAVPLFKSFHTSSILSRDRLPNVQLTHWDASSNRPAMVNVANKTPTLRTATASGRIFIPQVAYELIGDNPPATGPTSNSAMTCAKLEVAKAKARAKGDVLSVAQVAGIMGAKRTSDLIPLCHPLSLSHISVVLTPCPQSQGSTSSPSCMPSVYCEASVTCEGKTGVEMEALTAVSVSLLTVWDMLKAVAGKEMKIGDIHVSKKTGGKSGDFERVNGQHVHIES